METSYSNHGFGLIMTGKEIADFEERYNKINDGRLEYIGEITKDDGLNAMYYCDDFASGMLYRTLTMDKEEENIGCDEMLVFWAEKQPDPFKTQYTKESVVTEFKEKLGRYCPEGFDFYGHLGYFSCSA